MKLLVLASRFPYPLEKGDKLRLYHHLRHWSQRHQVVLFCLSEEPVPEAAIEEIRPYCQRLEVVRIRWVHRLWGATRALLQGEALQIGYFYRREAYRRLHALIEAERPERAVCQLVRMGPYAQASGLPVTLDYMDAFSAGIRRRAERARSWLRPLLRREADALAQAEKRYLHLFDSHSIISAQDREALGPAASAVAVAPNGVDTGFFAFVPPTVPRHEVAFVGNLGYHPNRLAALALARSIMPMVWESNPYARLLLAGARPPAEVKALATDPRITVTGWMNDIRSAYADARILAAPLFTGAGQQNKILEAMSAGLPCIATSLVNNALGASPGREILIADTRQEFADAIHKLLGSDRLRADMALAARQWVTQTFSWEASAAAVEQAFLTPTSP